MFLSFFSNTRTTHILWLDDEVELVAPVRLKPLMGCLQQEANFWYVSLQKVDTRVYRHLQRISGNSIYYKQASLAPRTWDVTHARYALWRRSDIHLLLNLAKPETVFLNWFHLLRTFLQYQAAVWDTVLRSKVHILFLEDQVLQPNLIRAEEKQRDRKSTV